MRRSWPRRRIAGAGTVRPARDARWLQLHRRNAVAIGQRVARGDFLPGFQTPAKSMGPILSLGLPDHVATNSSHSRRCRPTLCEFSSLNIDA